MKYRNLGRTGVKVSPLCLGTMNFGYRTNEEDSIAMINTAIGQGINFIDTANFYGQPANEGKGQGLTETIVGKALKGKRERIVLATKCAMPTADYPDDPNAAGISRRHIIQSCEESLHRLDTDYIDLYQLHFPQIHIPADETLRALDDLVRSGKVCYIGTSKFPSWLIVENIWTSKDLNLNRFVTEQMKYHVLNRAPERDLTTVAERYDVGLLPYSPLAGGLLTGKYSRDGEQPDDSRMKDETWGAWAQSFQTENMWEVLDTLGELAQAKEYTIAQIAVAWLLHQPTVSSVIMGPRTMEQYEGYMGALDVTLSEDDLAQIDKVAPSGK